MSKGTGHGAQLGFGTTAAKWAPSYTSLGSYGYEREALDCSHLGTVGMREYYRGDLYGITTLTGSYWWEPNDTTGQDEFALLLEDDDTAAEAELVTLTMPDGIIYSGQGFVVGLEYGEIATDLLLAATIDIQWSTKPSKS